MSDLEVLRSPIVRLKLTIDKTGNVTSAELFGSCGSDAIDQACRLAAQNWWFEPLKDPSGMPVDDVLLFAIRLY